MKGILSYLNFWYLGICSRGLLEFSEANPNLHRFGGSYKELYIFHVADRQVGTVDLKENKNTASWPLPFPERIRYPYKMGQEPIDI